MAGVSAGRSPLPPSLTYERADEASPVGREEAASNGDKGESRLPTPPRIARARPFVVRSGKERDTVDAPARVPSAQRPSRRPYARRGSGGGRLSAARPSA